MTIAMLFWVLMIIWLVFGVWAYWPLAKIHAPNFLLWFLLFLLGWGTFGWPVHG